MKTDLTPDELKKIASYLHDYRRVTGFRDEGKPKPERIKLGKITRKIEKMAEERRR